MLTLHFWPTGNGIKIPILLEELGLEFRPVLHNIRLGAHKTPEFAALNPHVKIPVLVDEPEGRARIVINESPAILSYLAEREGRFLPIERAARYAVQSWLFWHSAHLAPTLGLYQRLHEQIPEQATDALRQTVKDDVARIYARLDSHFTSHPYLAGDYSIADIAVFAWIQPRRQGQTLAAYPQLARWYEAICARPAVLRAYDYGRSIAPEEKALQDWR